MTAKAILRAAALLVGVVLLVPLSVRAHGDEEHAAKGGQAMAGGHAMTAMHSDEAKAAPLPALKATLASLLAEVKRLRKEVADLDAIKPSFTNFMPDFSERFHIMHYAGEAGDWAVAGHEAAELDRMVDVAQHIDPQKGQLMKAFIGEDLEKIDDLIAHGDKAGFIKQLSATVMHCNACHKAVGSPFIQVSLDVSPNMTVRHPHVLVKEKAMEHHHHG